MDDYSQSRNGSTTHDGPDLQPQRSQPHYEDADVDRGVNEPFEETQENYADGSSASAAHEPYEITSQHVQHYDYSGTFNSCFPRDAQDMQTLTPSLLLQQQLQQPLPMLQQQPHEVFNNQDLQHLEAMNSYANLYPLEPISNYDFDHTQNYYDFDPNSTYDFNQSLNNPSFFPAFPMQNSIPDNSSMQQDVSCNCVATRQLQHLLQLQPHLAQLLQQSFPDPGSFTALPPAAPNQQQKSLPTSGSSPARKVGHRKPFKKVSHKNSSCANCGTTKTSVWRRNVRGETECNACALYKSVNGIARPLNRKNEIIPRKSVRKISK